MNAGLRSLHKTRDSRDSEIAPTNRSVLVCGVRRWLSRFLSSRMRDVLSPSLSTRLIDRNPSGVP